MRQAGLVLWQNVLKDPLSSVAANWMPWGAEGFMASQSSSRMAGALNCAKNPEGADAGL